MRMPLHLVHTLFRTELKSTTLNGVVTALGSVLKGADMHQCPAACSLAQDCASSCQPDTECEDAATRAPTNPTGHSKEPLCVACHAAHMLQALSRCGRFHLLRKLLPGVTRVQLRALLLRLQEHLPAQTRAPLHVMDIAEAYDIDIGVVSA